MVVGDRRWLRGRRPGPPEPLTMPTGREPDPSRARLSDEPA
jgi:hypothetical protein